ncbi:hypothetical protein QJU89_06735 [Pasteurella skyensis]|uniref:Uncharacterized protein n=1 Tax=Phocoenobacter skyensis TaxID=97481 RepID=A0AAJ6N9K4_9PAST|nr:hypothetical protein [Pasteurella skyensis]MDP8162192.1 hypothetical protein [Pasteurella skyensis]MDP8172656.1 hypothetical protein [Pasteurella skyensis]MDP8176818.1 hypothetical protein [Pasteurella skyensis]MDP8179156.1 hypothetical protein [Pasteurella skyensis]MDP8183389.1 hypothetical protein [Pasteurella skyensis]
MRNSSPVNDIQNIYCSLEQAKSVIELMTIYYTDTGDLDIPEDVKINLLWTVQGLLEKSIEQTKKAEEKAITAERKAVKNG